VNRRVGYLVAVVLLFHATLISAQVNTRSGVKLLELVTFGSLAEVQRAAASAIGAARHVWTDYLALRDMRRENEELRARVAALEVTLQQQRALATRAGRLQALLSLRDQMDERTLAADVIAGDASALFNTITIDKGSSDGVRPDMAVLAPRGVVGRVVGQPASRAARVQLLVDRFAAAGAMLERTRTGGIIAGEAGDPPLRLQYVSNLADVQVGDVVVTSGIDGIYPKGYVIGSVERVGKGSGLYLDVRVRPSADFSALEEVLVVLDPPPAQARQGQGQS
jgi:rod shape-determining protein MreC